MNVTAFAKWTGTVLLLLTLGACGGSDDGDGGTGAQPSGTVVGAAGGTVVGPNGTKVVIPPGALATNTTIAIAQSSTGTPPFPGGITVSGLMFAFTPHGTTFALPVTVTLPFSAATVPAGSAPALYKTNAQNQWEQIASATFGADSVSAQVTSFSNFQAGIPPLQRNDPVRDWTFSLYSSSASTGITRGIVTGQDGSGTQVGGLLEKIAGFGSTALTDDELFLLTEIVPPDGQANGLVFSTGNGQTYGVFAEAPFGELGGINQPGGPNPIGGNASLLQRQSFIKRAPDASLTYTLTDVLICAFDYNLFPPTFGTDDAHTRITGVVLLSIQAWTSQTATKRVFFSVAGAAAVAGTRNFWVPIAQDFADGFSAEIWNKTHFDFTETAFTDEFGSGTDACLQLNTELVYTIDLSSIAIDEEFTVQSIAEADALNKRGGGAIGDHQASGVSAYLRDPASIGGTTLAFAGLEPTNRPDQTPPVQVPVAPASCLPGPGPDPTAGVIQFSAASYTIDESPGSLPTITVTRTGGSRGAVTATFNTSDGTAIGGADYTPVSITVFFRDGDATPRVVNVPILTNSIDAPDKSVNLALSQPGGCAALSTQTTAVLTIEDDDAPSQAGPSGTLDAGFGNAGKATSTAFGGDRSAMALQADGKIVMVGGTFTDFILARFNADGSLDTGFGVGGKVTTDMGGGNRPEEATAVAIQADGKIVVVGYTGIPTVPPAPALPLTFALARYNNDGSLDTSFGAGGKVSGNVNGEAYAVAIQGDGKIVVAGHFSFASSSGLDFSDFTVARFNANGSLDTSFGADVTGQVATDIGGSTNSARNIVLQPNGAIVVSGKPQGSSPGFDHTDIARYNSNGILDPSFGSGGKLTLVNKDVGAGLALQRDGKLVLVGTVIENTIPATARVLVMRLGVDGNLDTTFGTAGTVDTAFADSVSAGAVALQSDGKIVVAGSRAFSANSNFVVARYNTSGSVDSTFGVGGNVSIDFFGFSDVGESVVVQPDGKIVVGGLARNNVDGYGLARILP